MRIKKKKNSNEFSDKKLYFWRTYNGQEIDLAETRVDEIVAFEFKWGDIKNRHYLFKPQ